MLEVGFRRGIPISPEKMRIQYRVVGLWSTLPLAMNGFETDGMSDSLEGRGWHDLPTA